MALPYSSSLICGPNDDQVPSLLAEGYMYTGQADLGLDFIEQGLVAVNSTGEKTYEAEIYRLRGEMM